MNAYAFSSFFVCQEVEQVCRMEQQDLPNYISAVADDLSADYHDAFSYCFYA